MIGDILLYMDRVYVKNAKCESIVKMSLSIFCDVVLLSEKYRISLRIRDCLLALIKKERQGEVINRRDIKSAVDMMVALPGDGPLEVMNSVFQKDFLTASEEFYRIKCGQILEDCDASRYLQEVERILTREVEFSKSCLHHSTEPLLQAICEKVLLTDPMMLVLGMQNSGLYFLLNHNRLDDLKRMYKLFARTPNGLKVMAEQVGIYILLTILRVNVLIGSARSSFHLEKLSQESIAIALSQEQNVSLAKDDEMSALMKTSSSQNSLENKESAEQTLSAPFRWTTQILELKRRVTVCMVEAFQSDKTFDVNVTSSFQSALSKFEHSSEYLAAHINQLMCKKKEQTEEASEAIIDSAISLFRFVENKDVFETFYKKLLAKRLLHNKSMSEDLEHSVLGKLKVECGSQFTSKMEGMFKDMRTSADLNVSFREFITENPAKKPSFDVSVQVLTSTFWPISAAVVSCKLPTILADGAKLYEQYYLSKFSGRRLTFQPNLGSVDLRVQFNAKKHEFNTSTQQAIVLLQFFEHNVRTFDVLLEDTGMSVEDLSRSLQSLACGKFKILLKEPRSRDVLPTDKFRFNDAFTCPQVRIKIPVIVGATAKVADQAQESAETIAKIEESRKHMIDAAIVRVMKSRKMMESSLLVAEVTRQLSARFKPDPVIIKRCIDGLVEREFLEQGEGRTYNYLA